MKRPLPSIRTRPWPLVVLLAGLAASAVLVAAMSGSADAQAATGALAVFKVGPPASESFDVEVREASDQDDPVATLGVVGGGQSSAELETGEYTLSELPAEGFVLEGWALAIDGVCPGEPTDTDPLFEVTVTEEATTAVCVYNAEATVTLDGFLRLVKVGGRVGATYTFDLEGPDPVATVSVQGQSSTDVFGLDVGSYTVTEDEGSDLDFIGWALGDDDDLCPGEAESSAATFAFTILAGAETTVCAYNALPAPEIDNLAPASGPVSGGNNVVVTGSGFTGATAVHFGSQAASFTVESDTRITARAPASASPGEVTVRVTTPGGQSASATSARYTYANVLPAITLVSPRSGHTAGGMSVGIVGSGFTGATSVAFGGAPAVFSVESDTLILAVTPPHSPGSVRVVVRSGAGASPDTPADDFVFEVQLCPFFPLWVNDLAYGSRGGGFYWDPASGLVWTGERGQWHRFAPQPPRIAPGPLWVNALTYGGRGGGFYWDPVSGQVWIAERGWHLYEPRGCIARP